MDEWLEQYYRELIKDILLMKVAEMQRKAASDARYARICMSSEDERIQREATLAQETSRLLYIAARAMMESI